MTSPVTTEMLNESISMTSPVTTEMEGNNSYIVSFMMPPSYTLDTLPEPNDKRIVLKEVSDQTIAVYTFGGRANESRSNQKLALFKEQLNINGLETD